MSLIGFQHKARTLDDGTHRPFVLSFRRFAVVLFLALACSTPVSADAAPSHKKAIWGPARVNGISQFPIYRQLGVGIYQAQVRWNDVATKKPRHVLDPSDPAYAWNPEVDFAVSEAKRYGIRVSLVIIGTPSWANGVNDSRVPPKRYLRPR